MNAHRFRSMFILRHLAPFTTLCLFSLVAVCGFVASHAQQSTPEGEREVVEKIPKHLPIKVKIKKPEKLKDAKNEDWLGDVELEVTNTGTKPIYYLYISVRLPDVFAPTGHPFGYGLQYGRTALVALDEPVRPDDVPLLPGGVVVLKVPAERAELWRRGRAEGDRANPKKIELIFNDLNFGDGTGFIGSTGKPLPEVKERGANDTCPGGDGDALGAASAASPPQTKPPHLPRDLRCRLPVEGTWRRPTLPVALARRRRDGENCVDLATRIEVQVHAPRKLANAPGAVTSHGY